LEAISYFPYICNGNRQLRRERSRSLLLLSGMNTEIQIRTIQQKIENMLAEDPGYFLVELKINAGNNIKAFIDADQGASIDKLVQYNRGLYKLLEGEALFPDNDFSLEISSPGLEEPLKLHRQYVKNTGRFVEVIKNDGVKIEGKLSGVGETDIVVEEEKGKGKKKEIVQHRIVRDDIKTTKVQIKF